MMTDTQTNLSKLPLPIRFHLTDDVLRAIELFPDAKRRLNGGEIEFESKPGETRFKVRLPINRKS